jgi:putative transposase
VLLRLANLGVTNVFALLRLLPMSSQDKDAEILCCATSSLSCSAARSGQGGFAPADRALLAALLRRLPRHVLKELPLVVRPDAVFRWHRDMAVRRHASGPAGPRSCAGTRPG